jgi:hypothetical protein
MLLRQMLCPFGQGFGLRQDQLGVMGTSQVFPLTEGISDEGSVRQPMNFLDRII